MTSGPKIIWILTAVFVIGFIVFIFRFGTFEKLGSLGIGGGAGTGESRFRLGAPNIPVPDYGSGSVSRRRSDEISLDVEAEQPKPIEEKPKNIPAGFTEDQISPYYGMVNISSARAGSLTSRGQVRLSASFSEDVLLNITGWSLQAERGSQIVPRAVNVYNPLGTASESDIFLARREYLTMYTNSSAIGLNLRLNKCTGYLEKNQNFSPPLPKSCPNPVYDFDMSRVTGACQDYLRSLSSCRLPSASPPIPNTDYACRDYLDEINMRGCYDRHRADVDFLSREWRAWTGNVFLDSRHDTIHLLDRDGKLVDIYSY